jgi:hypothetical protein
LSESINQVKEGVAAGAVGGDKAEQINSKKHNL